MIDKATIDRVMDAANIVDVVSEFVTLRKVGANYKGLCPFHNERTPSFYVSPSRGICHCFSCGKTATPVSFIMDQEQMTYPEAIKWLARKYSIEVHETEISDKEKQERSERESMFVVNEWAANHFHDVLLHDEDGQAVGMQYFRSRGFRDDIIERFRLGFAPKKYGVFAQKAFSEGYKEAYLLKTGLCFKRDNGDLVSRYQGRVIFPWVNISGKVCAFGGRLLDQRTKGVQQKYVNSPDSEIYHKERELYGIYQGKREIARQDLVYMVEGYTDVISMHQMGVQNVVANSGTALSVYQIRLLHRLTNNIVLLYDGDEAGIHAAMRGTDMLLAEGMRIKVLVLPDGDDPDSFARKHSSDDFRAYLEANQTDFIEFKTRMLLKGVTDPIKRSEAISSIVKSISQIDNEIVRDTYIKDCAHRLDMKEKTLIDAMNTFILGKKDEQQRAIRREMRNNMPLSAVHRAANGAPKTQDKGQLDKVEEMLVEMIVRHGGEVIFKEVETEDGKTISLTVAQYIGYDLGSDNLTFSSPVAQKILQEAMEKSGEEGFESEKYFMQHSDIDVANMAVSVAVDKYSLSPSLQVKAQEDTLRNQVRHLVLDFRRCFVELKLLSLRQQMKQCQGDQERFMALMQQFKDVQELRNKIAPKVGMQVVF